MKKVKNSSLLERRLDIFAGDGKCFGLHINSRGGVETWGGAQVSGGALRQQ